MVLCVRGGAVKRKRREESAFNWPVIGIDLPYPEHVREALRLVAEETQRRLRETCEHEQAHSTGSFRATYRYDEMWDNSWHCITCGYDWTTHDRRSAGPRNTWREWQQRRNYRVPHELVPISITGPISSIDGISVSRADGSPVLNAPAEAEAELTAQFDRIYHRGNADGFTDHMIRQLETLADQVDQARQRRAGRLRESNE